MKFIRLLIAVLFLSLLGLAIRASASAEPTAPFTNQISFNSFTGVYHLSRDSHGLSLLTTEETILANFPANGFSGITRELPKQFQNQSVGLKVLGISDASGTSIPYKTTSTKDNLTITTGNPDIILSGSQTFKINYQTSGVVNLDKHADTLLLNVNGRGWNAPFDSVDATLYVPKSFNARLSSNPSCYTSLTSATANNCTVTTQRTSEVTVITARASPVAAHQALVVKIDFAPATFTDHHSSTKKLIVGVSTALVIGILAVFLLQKRRQSS